MNDDTTGTQMSVGGELRARMQAQENRLDRFEAYIKQEIGGLASKLDQFHRDSAESRRFNWQPIIALIAAFSLIGMILVFGMSVWINKSDAHIRDVMSAESRMHLNTVDRLHMLESVQREIGERTRWMQGEYTEAIQSIRARLDAIEKTNPRRPIDVRPE